MMTEMMRCGANMGETETTTSVEPSSQAARRRRMEIHKFRFVASDAAVAPLSENGGRKRPRMNGEKFRKRVKLEPAVEVEESEFKALDSDRTNHTEPPLVTVKFGSTSVCGRRRDMEDAVAIHPSFTRDKNSENSSSSPHFFGVYDGHGCSHVAMKCKDRMHEIVKTELEKSGESTLKEMMMRSFSQMDKEVIDWSSTGAASSSNSCRCELQTPQCDAVGSTAVVAVVTPDNIVVSNCGDSRAVLCRNGAPIPLSSDHKPDRPDELKRIEEAGGRVIYWDGPRVLGVLAMSRAIGDNYLKPYVISEPEVTITERTDADECLILASDGLWDVVSNETACRVARMCLQSAGRPPSPSRSPGSDVTVTSAGESSDKACLDASILLTKLALARHSTDNVSVVVIDLSKTRSLV